MVNIEVWSDFVCPFCFMGKRQLQRALEKNRNIETHITWRSFQLEPDALNQPGKTIYEYLAERKNITLEQSRAMHAQVTGRASDLGLTYNFDRAKVYNTFDAHRLMQFAQQNGKADRVNELLFDGHFTQGLDLSNHDTLADIGVQAGLDKEEVKAMLESDAMTREVREDIHLAQRTGVRGVPFFLFAGKYAVTGAQDASILSAALQRTEELAH